MFKDDSVKLYPLLARSKNMMEYFLIIGYEERDLPKEKTSHEMSLISCISSDLSFKNIDINSIINKIYPNIPEITKNIKAIPREIESVIFYNCENSKNEAKKICYSCYALRFYEKYNDNYIPKAFAIISEYPFFTIFHRICLNLYENFIEKNKENKENEKIEKKKENKEDKENKENKENKEKEIEDYIKNKIPIEIFLHCLVNYSVSPINSNIIFSVFKNDEPIIIPQLTAYPSIDFDLFSIINKVPINEFIKIYILTFLEIPLLFFSHKIDKLNLIMFALYILNYPLIDTTYFWYIYSISEIDMKKGFQHPGPTLRGVNINYSNELDISAFDGLEFIVDFHKKILTYKKGSNSKELNEIKKLLEFKKKKKEKSFLIDALTILERKLNEIKTVYNRDIKKKEETFFYVDEHVKKINKEIQKAFYDFNLSILVELYKEYQLNETCDSIIKNANKNKKLPEGENIFLNYIKRTEKYNIYFNNFVQNFDFIDGYSMSLFFCDYFVNKKIIDSKNKTSNNIDYFGIIDELYDLNKNNKVINFQTIFKDEDIKNINNIKYKKGKTEFKRNLFCLDKKIIDTFLFYKKNSPKFESFRENENIIIDIKSLKKKDIYLKIKNSISKKKEIISPNCNLEISLVYIFSIAFPFISFTISSQHLQIILDNIKNNYYRRDSLYELLRSIYKYYSVNQANKHFSELNFKAITKYCELIKYFLIYNEILPTEEIFLFLKEILFEKKIDVNEEDNKIKEGQNNFIFQYKKEAINNNNNNEINDNLVKKNGNKLILMHNGKSEEYQYFPPDKIYSEIFSFYDNYFSQDLDILNFQVKVFIELVVNALYYALNNIGARRNDVCSFLYNSIVILKQLEIDIKI